MNIGSLTSLRFLFAFWVVILHTVGDPYFEIQLPGWILEIINHGYLGVSFFFVLSGFVLTLAYRDQSWMEGRRGFYISRLSRIYPVYFLAMLLSFYFPYHYFNEGRRVFMGIEISALEVMLAAALIVFPLLQAWVFPVANFWNPPSWTLSAEMAFYFVFPSFVIWAKRRGLISIYRLLAANCLAIFFIAFCMEALKGRVSEFILQGVIDNPILRFFEFSLGVLVSIAFLYHKQSCKYDSIDVLKWLKNWSVFSVVLLIVISSCIPYSLHWFNIAVSAPILAFLIFCLAILECNSKNLILSSRLLMLLGNSSYGMYILHVPIMLWIKKAVDVGLIRISGAELCLIYFSATIVGSVVVYFTFERPLRALILSKFSRSRLVVHPSVS